MDFKRKMNSPLVSIIILNFNCKKFLKNCLLSVLNTNYPNYEIIFVDNNSTDGSLDFVRNRFKTYRIKLIELKKNEGYAIGNNFGAGIAKGDYLVFLNPDTITDPQWLTNLIKVFETNETISIGQPKLLKMDGIRFDSAGCFMNPFGLVWVRGSGEEDKGQYQEITEIFFAKGAALIIRRKLWELLGGFDPIFFNYFEETDLCWRALKIGQSVAYIPNSIVYHKGGGILDIFSFHLKFHEARGRLIILTKNHVLSDFFCNLPITLLLHVLNMGLQLVRGNGFTGVAILKGTLWYVTNFRRIWHLRIKAQNISLNEFKKQFQNRINTLFQIGCKFNNLKR